MESLAITSSISCSQVPDERSELLMSSLGFSLILSLSLSLSLRLVRGEHWSCFLLDATICQARSTLLLSQSSTKNRPAGRGDQAQSFAAPQALPAVWEHGLCP